MLTDKGWDLMRATGALPITRKTADRLLATTLDRADTMRAEWTRFAYTPARIYVYGSYLTDKERLGDLDVAVEWEPRYEDRAKQSKYNEALATEYQTSGRRFGNFSEFLHHGYRQAVLFLRNRARALSLNNIEFPEQRENRVYTVTHRVVYDHGERPPHV